MTRSAGITDTVALPGVAGAQVRYGHEVPEQLPGAVRVGPFSVARPGAMLRIVPGLARFLAHDGQWIDVQAETGVERSQLTPLLYGPLAASLIHQRGELPLHGAVLQPPGTACAWAVVGPQGAGKSTLAWALLQNGWQLVSDDLTRLTRAEGGEIEAWPGRPGVKLCQDACERFGLDSRQMPAVAGERDKRLASMAPVPGPLPLAGIVVLNRTSAESTVTLQGAAALAALTSNTFRPRYIAALGQTHAHLAMASSVLARVRLLQLGGPGTPHHYAERLALLATHDSPAS